jgi:drug/metabolite transporter (DMT)-like permease
MQTFLSVLAGLAWGAIWGLINAAVTKKLASGSEQQLSSMSLIRTLIDAAALAAVYFTRSLLPLRFPHTLVATAVSLSVIGIVAAFRVSKSMRK